MGDFDGKWQTILHAIKITLNVGWIYGWFYWCFSNAYIRGSYGNGGLASKKNNLQDMIAAAAEDPQESYEQLLGLSVVAACGTRGLRVPGMW